MTVEVMGEGEVLREVSDLLLQHLDPVKTIRFWASWQMGREDYLRWRDEQFGDETVATLYDKVVAYQESQTE